MSAVAESQNKQASEHQNQESAHSIYRNPAHQLAAAKLGMWIFIATEILMFGGLFCVYAVYRSKSPIAFIRGSQLLDIGWGTINTIVLITSSFTIAAAIHFTQLGKRRVAVFLLIMTVLLGIDFMGIKSIEYAQKMRHGLFPGSEPVWDQNSGSDIKKSAQAAVVNVLAPVGPGIAPEGDVGNGLMIYNATCRACHGKEGVGINGVAPDLVTSKFVLESSQQKLFEMVLAGRTPDSSDSVMKGYMPPRGGNSQLTNQHVSDVVAYVQKLSSGDSTPIVASGGANSAAEALALVPRWNHPPAADPPPGLKPAMFTRGTPVFVEKTDGQPPRPASMRQFLSIYYLMTGLHGLHVVIGLCVISWLAWAVARKKIGRHRFAPLELGGLFWHTVDLVWLFLFPLLYLTGHG